MLARLALLIIGMTSLGARAQFAGNFMASNQCGAYFGQLKSFGMTDTWRFVETSGTTALNQYGSAPMAIVGSPTLNQPGPLVMPSKAVTFNGTNQFAYSTTAVTNPTVYTELIWFKTTTTTGGKLIGFGNSTTTSSGNYDRHLYMTNAGNVVWGVYGGLVQTVVSTATYRDGNWHMAVGTMGTGGMELIVDGVSIGTNANTLSQAYNGYWHVGFDNLSGWTSAPSSNYFNGQLAEPAVGVGYKMTAVQAAQLYRLGLNCSN